MFFSPVTQRNSTEQLSNKLRIFSYTPLNKTTLNEEVKQIIDYYGYASWSYPDFKPNSKQLVNISHTSIPTQILNYSYSDFDGRIVNTTEIITKSNDKVYSFLYSAQNKTSVDMYRQSSMADSFAMYKRPKISKNR